MKPAPPAKKNYSAKEAAAILGVSTNTLYKYLEEGKIRSRRFGQGRFKIPANELTPFIEEATETMPSDDQVSVKPAETPIINSEKIQSADLLDMGSSTQSVDLRPLTEETSASQNSWAIPSGAPLVNAKVSADIADDNDKLGQDSLISFGVNDIVFFRMFKALVILGLGIIYLTTSPLNIAFNLTNLFDLNGIFRSVLPLSLIAIGILNMLEVVFYGKRIVSHIAIDLLATATLGYYAFLTVVSGNYGLFIFVASFCGISLDHLISDIKSDNREHNFQRSFTKYTLLLSIISGLVLLMSPALFPITFISDFITTRREVFGFMWFVIVLLPAVFILTTFGSRSQIRVPYYALGSVLSLVVAVKLMIVPNFDVAYICLITGIFRLFMAWWIESNVVFEPGKIKYLFLSFSWVSVVILISLFTINLYQGQFEHKFSDSLQNDLNEFTSTVQTKLAQRESALISFSGKLELKTAISEGNEDASTAMAKEIYDKIGNLNRALILDSEGVAVGVYPRDVMAEGTNFSSRTYFQETVKTKNGYMSDVFENIYGDDAVVQTEPVFMDNEIIGIIGISTQEYNFIKEFGFTDAKYGIRIFDSVDKQILSTNGALPTGEGASVAYPGPAKNDKTIYLSRQLDGPDWKIAVYAKPALASNNLSSLTIGLLIITALNSIFSIFTGIAISRQKEVVKVVGDRNYVPKGLATV